jgi:hypothetical protein
MNIGQSKIKEQNVSLQSVIDLLKQQSSLTELATILNRISLHPDFKYLKALVNHSKHRSIVGTIFSVDPPVKGQPPYTLLFEAFTYRGDPFPQREVQLFLEPTYAWLSQEIVICGNALNRVICNEHSSLKYQGSHS